MENGKEFALFSEQIIAWLHDYMGYVWIIIAILFLFSELNTPGLFFFISFSVGSLCAAVLAFMNYSLIIQCVSALIVSLVTFFLLRIYLKKTKLSDVLYGSAETNIDALVGASGIVVFEITQQSPGRVRIRGEIWQARGKEGMVFEEGVVVEVVRVEGNTVIVKAKED